MLMPICGDQLSWKLFGCGVCCWILMNCVGGDYLNVCVGLLLEKACLGKKICMCFLISMRLCRVNWTVE